MREGRGGRRGGGEAGERGKGERGRREEVKKSVSQSQTVCEYNYADGEYFTLVCGNHFLTL